MPKELNAITPIAYRERASLTQISVKDVFNEAFWLKLALNKKILSEVIERERILCNVLYNGL